MEIRKHENEKERNMNSQIIKFSAVAVLAQAIILSLARLQAQTNEYRQDRILVKPAVANIDVLHQQLGTRVLRSYPQIGNIQVVLLPQGLSVPQAIAQFQSSGQVLY